MKNCSLIESWLVSFATLRRALATVRMTVLLFDRQIKERTMSQQNTMSNVISTGHKYNKKMDIASEMCTH